MAKVLLSPASRSEEGGLLNSPSSVRPLTSNNFIQLIVQSSIVLISKKHHYIIKAGDSRATRTLVLFGERKGLDLICT